MGFSFPTPGVDPGCGFDVIIWSTWFLSFVMIFCCFSSLEQADISFKVPDTR